MSIILTVSGILKDLSYRRPMMVRELMFFPDTLYQESYYVCPRCQITMDREFMHYCDRCGQCLAWGEYEKAKIVYPGRKRREAKAQCPDATHIAGLQFFFKKWR